VLGDEDSTLQAQSLAELLLPQLDRGRVSDGGEPVVENDFL